MMITDYRYLDKTVYCRLGASQLEGVGVFAIRDIPRGTQLTDYYGGPLVYVKLEESDFDFLVPEVKGLILDRTIFSAHEDLVFMSPNCNQIFQAFMNNSKDPNSNGKSALRDIKKGEEITINYKVLTPDIHNVSKVLINKSL